MIITITLNPAIDKTAQLEHVQLYGLNRLERVKRDAGGKGINVSKTIKKLGGQSIATGFLGGATGQFIKEALGEQQIEDKMIEIRGMTRENLKLVDSQGRLTELNESGPVLTSKEIHQLTNLVVHTAKPNDIVVISGSIPPSLPKETYANLIQDFKKNQLQVILDADGEAFGHAVVAGPAVIKPNTYELAKYFGLAEETMTQEQIIGCARQLLVHQVKLVVVSMGKDGALFVNSTQVWKSTGLKVDVKSTVGAGDAMVAAIAVSLERKDSLEAMIRLAMASGAGAVMQEGTNPADYEVVAELMKQVHLEQLEVM